MELKHYINILFRRKWMIILTIAITMAVVVIGTQLQTPIYEASATLRIAASAGGQLIYPNLTYVDRLMNTYVEIATSDPILDELVKRLDISKPPMIKAEIIPNTELIKITVEDTNPKLVAAAANTLADILMAQSNQLYTGGGKTSQEILGEQLVIAQTDLDQTRKEYGKLVIQTPAAPERIEATRQSLQLKQNAFTTLLGQYEQAAYREEIQSSMITVIESANMPNAYSQPRVMLNYSLGLIVGLIGGMGLAFIFENLDTK
ncbi:MAG: hypothetical protein HZB50_02470 [Chloroflexi bacterium]|nr:hypothetical protein [Chloroflexota bacterium]